VEQLRMLTKEAKTMLISVSFRVFQISDIYILAVATNVSLAYPAGK
jgi:hypothetical protein